MTRTLAIADCLVIVAFFATMIGIGYLVAVLLFVGPPLFFCAMSARVFMPGLDMGPAEANSLPIEMQRRGRSHASFAKFCVCEASAFQS